MKKIGLLLLFILCLPGCIRVDWGQPDWGEALTTHNLILKSSSYLEFLWVRTVFTHDFAARELAATNGKVFFIGSLTQNGARGVIALDEKTGSELWQVPEPLTVEVGPDMVYVDDGNSVVAYALTGEKLWQTKLRGVRNIGGFNAIEGKLYVAAGGSYYLLDATTGELLDSSSDFKPELALYYWYNSAFIKGRVFTLEEGTYFGPVVAMEFGSGDLLWRNVDNVISNVAANDNLVFVITDEDELRILNAATGKLLETIRIEPSINFFELGAETSVQHEGYFLAVDETNQILYVLLGDSNQLFAFKIHQ